MTDRIVAIAFLTERDLQRIGGSLSHCFPVEDDAVFDHLLTQLNTVEVEPLGRSVVLRAQQSG